VPPDCSVNAPSVTVGAVVSYVAETCVAAVLSLPAASLNVAAPTSNETTPSAVGVRVAVKLVPDPLKVAVALIGVRSLASNAVLLPAASLKVIADV
jgi:hypothetical protein